MNMVPDYIEQQMTHAARSLRGELLNKKPFCHIFGLDGVLLDSKGDWTEATLIPDNLMNLDLIRALEMRAEYWIIVTGRHYKQRSRIQALFHPHPPVFGRYWDRTDWDRPDDLTGRRFFAWYWAEKLRHILNVPPAERDVIVYEDDPVICAMCKALGIKYVRFIEGVPEGEHSPVTEDPSYNEYQRIVQWVREDHLQKASTSERSLFCLLRDAELDAAATCQLKRCLSHPWRVLKMAADFREQMYDEPIQTEFMSKCTKRQE
jgi:hypothetical protein